MKAHRLLEAESSRAKVKVSFDWWGTTDDLDILLTSVMEHMNVEMFRGRASRTVQSDWWTEDTLGKMKEEMS